MASAGTITASSTRPGTSLARVAAAAVPAGSPPRGYTSEQRRTVFVRPFGELASRLANLAAAETPSVYHRDQPVVVGALVDSYA